MRHTVTDIQIEKVNPENGLVGFCNFTVDGKFRFNSVAIFSRIEGGIRLSWPEKKRGLKKIKTASPIHPESYEQIEGEVLRAFNAESKNEN